MHALIPTAFWSKEWRLVVSQERTKWENAVEWEGYTFCTMPGSRPTCFTSHLTVRPSGLVQETRCCSWMCAMTCVAGCTIRWAADPYIYMELSCRPTQPMNTQWRGAHLRCLKCDGGYWKQWWMAVSGRRGSFTSLRKLLLKTVFCIFVFIYLLWYVSDPRAPVLLSIQSVSACGWRSLDMSGSCGYIE